MSDSKLNDDTVSRPTLKLKVAPRVRREEPKAASAPRPPSNPKLKPGAHWSDEYKSRMQAEMDALARR